MSDLDKIDNALDVCNFGYCQPKSKPSRREERGVAIVPENETLRDNNHQMIITAGWKA